MIGSNQLSTAVGEQVQGDNNAINETNNATIAAQTGLNNAVGSANNTLASTYGSETNNLNPYLQAGQQGITSLASMLQPGGALTQQFTAPTAAQAAAQPGYQFQLQAGDQAATRAAAAQGLGNSGNLATSLSQFNQGLAATNYNNLYNQNLTTFQTNRQNTLQPLSTLINSGQTATGQLNSAAQNYGNTTGTNDLYGATYSGNAGQAGAKTVSSLLQGIGQSESAGSIGQGNIWSPIAGSAGAAAGTALGIPSIPGIT